MDTDGEGADEEGEGEGEVVRGDAGPDADSSLDSAWNEERPHGLVVSSSAG